MLHKRVVTHLHNSIIIYAINSLYDVQIYLIIPNLRVIKILTYLDVIVKKEKKYFRNIMGPKLNNGIWKLRRNREINVSINITKKRGLFS